MKYEVTIGGATRSVQVRRAREGGWWIAVDDAPERLVRGGHVGTAEWQVEDGDGARRTVGLVADGSAVHVQIGGHPLRVQVTDPRKDALALGAAGRAGAVITEMPGAVVRLLVAEGDRVEEGRPVVVVEAMKMENELKAPVSGVVSSIEVAPGDRVESHSLLLVIQPEEP